MKSGEVVRANSPAETTFYPADICRGVWEHVLTAIERAHQALADGTIQVGHYHDLLMNTPG